MKNIEYKLCVDGVAMSFWKGGGDTTIVFASGFPQYVTGYHPFINTLVSLGYSVLVPKYGGSWESKGVFSVKTSVHSIDTAIQVVRSGLAQELFGNTSIDIPNKKVFLIGFSFGGLIALLSKEEVDKKILLTPFINLQLHGKEKIEAETDFIRRAYGEAYRFETDVLVRELESVQYPETSQDLTVVLGSRDKSISSEEIQWLSEKNKVQIVSVDSSHSANLSVEQFGQFL